MRYWTKSSENELFKIVHSDVSSFSPEIHWDDRLKVGWYPITQEEDYGEDYFQKYVGYEGSAVEASLNNFRSQFVDMHYRGAVVDIGIGCGTFINRRGRLNTSGYDVGSKSISWLKDQDLWTDPYECSSVSAITCWDSLEHIRDYRPLLSKVSKWAFMSVPIFVDCYHASRSKHFRPEEHWWYFTNDSIVSMMALHGFKLVSQSSMEQVIGREDINCYAFSRVSNA